MGLLIYCAVCYVGMFLLILASLILEGYRLLNEPPYKTTLREIIKSDLENFGRGGDMMFWVVLLAPIFLPMIIVYLIVSLILDAPLENKKLIIGQELEK